MVFKVRYRGPDGSMREGTVEATGRAECIATCHARGISPLAIRQGGKDVKGAKAVKVLNGDRGIKGLVAILAILAVAGVGWWLVTRGDLDDKIPNSNKGVKAVKAVKATNNDDKGTKGLKVPNDDKGTKGLKVLNGDNGDKPLNGTNDGKGRVVHMDAVAVSNYVATHYSTNSAVRPIDPNDPDLPLITGINQELGSLMSSELGDPVPPFPYSFLVESPNDQNDEFIKSLKHKVALRENDSQTRAESKQKILQARLDLLDALDQGMSVKDTIKEAYIQRVRAYEARQAYIEDLRDWALENPNAAEFRQGLEETNKKLGEKGIKKITLDDLGVEGLSDEDEASQSKERRK